MNNWVRRFLSKANYEAKLHNFSGWVGAGIVYSCVQKWEVVK